MRKFLFYTLILFAIAGIYIFFWESMSSFWQKASIIAASIIGFFAIKDLLSWLISFVSDDFSKLFLFILGVIGSVLFFFFGYQGLENESEVKTNIDEMKTSVQDFFALPQRSTNNGSEVLTINSTSEAERRFMTTDEASSEAERIAALEQSIEQSRLAESSQEITREFANKDQEENTQKIDPLVALLASPQSETPEDNDISLLSDSISFAKENSVTEDSKEDSKDATKNTENKATETIENNKIMSDTKEEKNKEITLEYREESEQNWKTPVVQFANSPEPTEPIVITSADNKNVTAVAAEENNKKNDSENNASNTTDNKKTTESKDQSVETKISSSLSESGIHLPSSGERDEKFKIMFRDISAQIVYPLEYVLSNAVWTDKENTIDSVSFTVTTPKSVQSNIEIDVTNSGEMFKKYSQYFTSEYSETENLFFIETTTNNTVEYISFFGGNCWTITVSLPKESQPTLDDFYDILLPAVFEGKE